MAVIDTTTLQVVNSDAYGVSGRGLILPGTGDLFVTLAIFWPIMRIRLRATVVMRWAD